MNTKPSILKAADLPVKTGTIYPPEFAGAVEGRSRQVMGNPFGLSQFGVNLARLEPGAWSSQRHWHECEDEFIYVLEGELTLIDDQGAHVMGPGMCAGFKAGVSNAHHLVNRSTAPACYLEVGSRLDDEKVDYPDIDLRAEKTAGGAYKLLHKDGTEYASG